MMILESGSVRVVNPATEEEISEVKTPSKEDLDATVDRARAGFLEWQGFAGLDRAELFHDLGHNLRDHADELAELIEDLPEGLFQVVYGAGDVGEALVRHPGVDMVAFTGSQQTGRKVGVMAAERLIRANLELGGKDPFIICDDVDIEIAARGAVWAACLNAGQVCTSAERFYVMKNIADEFVEASKSYVESLHIGDPMDERTDIGPLINAPGREKVERHVGEAVRRGAKVVAGGERWG